MTDLGPDAWRFEGQADFSGTLHRRTCGGPPKPPRSEAPRRSRGAPRDCWTSELHETPNPLDAAAHRVPSMDGIGEPMVAALDDHEVARLRRPRVEDRAVLDGHHLVGVALDRQVTCDT